MFLTVNYGDYADPAALLTTVALPGAVQNYDKFNNPQLTTLLDQARSTADPDKRAALVAKAEQLAASAAVDPGRAADKRAGAQQEPDRRGRLVLLHVRARGPTASAAKS